MSLLSDNYICLFLHLGEPCVYIVDNKLINFETFAGIENCPFKAWNLLLELYKQCKNSDFLPHELIKYFENKTPIKIESFWDCIIGTNDPVSSSRCLDAEMVISKTNPLVVTFLKFVLHRGWNEKNHFDISASLSLRDMFYTLGNICVNGRPTNFLDLDKINYETYIDDIKANNEWYEDYFKMVDDRIGNCEGFILAYLEVIRKQLLQGIISPKELLLNSGALTLAVFAGLKPVTAFIRQIMNKDLLLLDKFSNLSVVYYTFLTEIWGVDIHNEVLEFLADKRDIFDQIEAKFRLDNNLNNDL